MKELQKAVPAQRTVKI